MYAPLYARSRALEKCLGESDAQYIVVIEEDVWATEDFLGKLDEVVRGLEGEEVRIGINCITGDIIHAEESECTPKSIPAPSLRSPPLCLLPSTPLTH
jgi:GR25 family glycosyltransferase involved in LPS biosynthesis